MKKKLVGADNLDSFICKADGKLYADGSVILTAGARDELSRRGIAVEYGPRPGAGAYAPAHGDCPPGYTCPPGCTCAACAAGAVAACTAEAAGHTDLEGLVLGVAAILKNEFGIHDPEELKAVSCEAVKVIRDNI
ncbi:hypothetical protein [Desulfovibrio psychrotolerans]|nr:hypothetical protein [Desulfovibrio psychrotolerans]